MSRSDCINRAKATIESRYNRSKYQFDQNILEASLKIKGFSEVDGYIKATGARILSAAVSNTGSIDEIRRDYENAVKRKKTLLLENGYPADYCDLKHYCDKCGDTGYVGIRICNCLKREINYELLKESGLYHLSKTQSFDTFSFKYYYEDEENLQKIKEHYEDLKAFAEGFGDETYANFLLMGPTGLGKTHLSTATAVTVIDKGYYVIYESAVNIFENYQALEFRKDKTADTDKYTECDLLVIDDLGAEMNNPFYVEKLYSLINERTNNNKSTIINTNLTAEELVKKYDQRIVSRLLGEYFVLPFRGTDVRMQKLS